MKRIAWSTLLALTALALGGCTSSGMQGETARTAGMADSDYGRTSEDSGSAGSASGSSGAMGSSGGAGTTSSGGAGQAGQAGQAGTPNSTVANIEIIPRQSGDTAGSAGSVAGAAVGDAGSSSSDQVYRITLQMDDGTLRTITQENAPSFSTGDRVRLSGGAIMR